jgi:hypothetical protein
MSKPHRFTPGSLSQSEREAAEAVADSWPQPSAGLAHALREGFAPALRRRRERQLREAGVKLPEE